MPGLKQGDTIPHFSLPDQEVKIFDIDTVLGEKNIVLFFYPLDESPGCTREVCYFRDFYDTIRQLNGEVIGISGQSVESHRNFAGKHDLPYRILSDEGNKVRKMFGVPGSFFGMIPGRVTYVAGTDGKIVHVFNSQNKPEKHVDEALKILFILSGTANNNKS